MDVIVLATSFPRHVGDHAGRFVLDVSRGLAERGHRLIHLVPEADGAPPTESRGEGLLVRRVPFARRRGDLDLCYGDGIGSNLRARPLRLAAVPRLLRAMKRALDEELDRRPDAALLSHWIFPCGAIAAAAARARSVAHVSIAHGGDVHLLAGSMLLRRRFRDWAAGTHRAIFVSRALRERAAGVLGDRRMPSGRVLAMGVDRARFAARGRREMLRARLGVEASRFVVLTVGRLVRLKGFDLALRALDGVEGATLLLAGAGPERDRLERLASRLGIDARFFGGIDDDAVAGLMECADALLVPSRIGRRRRTEGCPIVIAEAFAAGLPVVGSISGGIPDRVRHGENGLLVPPSDHRVLRRTLIDLALDAGLRRRLAAGALADADACDYTRTAAAVESELIAAAGETRRCPTTARP